MTKTNSSSLITLPIELVYRILDHLNDITILCSIRNVCTKLNTIIETYHRYEVKLTFILFSISFETVKNHKSYLHRH